MPYPKLTANIFDMFSAVFELYDDSIEEDDIHSWSKKAAKYLYKFEKENILAYTRIAELSEKELTKIGEAAKDSLGPYYVLLDNPNKVRIIIFRTPNN